MSLRRRRRCPDHGRDGPPGTRGTDRHPPELAPRGPGDRRKPAPGPDGGRTCCARRDRHVQGLRLRLLPGAGNPARDDRLRAARFTSRAGGVDARPRHRQLLQDRRRLRGQESVGQPHARPDPRQHHGVLAHRHGRLGGSLVLGERTGAGHGAGGRAGNSGGQDPGRLHHVPRRDLADPAQLGRGRLRDDAYFNEVEKGGHFAAWEEPELFTTEVRAAFRPLH